MKKIFIALFLVLGVFILAGCSEAQNDSNVSGNETANEYNLLAEESIPERKIIYTVDMSLDVSDLETASSFIDALLNDDEWYDEEVIQSTYYSYVIRIKTDRLDDFISSLKDEFTLRQYQKVGTDISLNYQETENRIAALEAQLTRLVALYEQASLSDMILINQQISEIEVELQDLNGEILEFDSLVDYSVVNLTIYGSSIMSQSPFINRIGNAFVNGFNGLLAFFDALLIGIATISPFLVIIGGSAYGIYAFQKRRRNKKKNK